jgi:hypothetical protein
MRRGQNEKESFSVPMCASDRSDKESCLEKAGREVDTNYDIIYRAGDILRKIYDLLEISYEFGLNPLPALRLNFPSFEFKYHDLVDIENTLKVVAQSDYTLFLGSHFNDRGHCNEIVTITSRKAGHRMWKMLVINYKWNERKKRVKDRGQHLGYHLKKAGVHEVALVGDKTQNGLYVIK